MIIQIIGAFFATFFFSIMFNVNRSELIICGIVGAGGWTLYLFSQEYKASVILSSFLAALLVSILSQILAIYRKNPVTTYQIAGIIPLVPGAGMYQSLYYLIEEKEETAFHYLLQTIEIAGSIAVAMLLVTSITTFVIRLKKANIDP
ncbi:MAG: threonine/serine exporter family protein [Vallitaleaceae bacterium]|nr:threonine/serine exporter family protein [Vallitaleaceae bacterium]